MHCLVCDIMAWGDSVHCLVCVTSWGDCVYILSSLYVKSPYAGETACVYCLVCDITTGGDCVHCLMDAILTVPIIFL